MGFRGNRGDTQGQSYDDERGRPLYRLHLRESKALGEGRGNTFIVFPKGGRKEIAGEAVNSGVVRELQRKLYQKAKQEERKRLEEDDRKAVFGKTERTV